MKWKSIGFLCKFCQKYEEMDSMRQPLSTINLPGYYEEVRLWFALSQL